MNLRTPFDVFMLTFRTNRQAHKEYGKDYTFEDFCGLLVIVQHRFLEELNLGGKHEAHLFKGKGKMDPRDRVQFDASTQKPAYCDQKIHRQEDAPQQS
jgi:hypothetical protein